MNAYSGFSAWIAEEAAIYGVLKAIVSDDKVSFDAAGDDDIYSVVLHPAPRAGIDRWVGEWRLRNDNSKGHAEAWLYRTAGGRIALVGHWEEEGERYIWVTELIPN